jgi:hypothetical protein
MVATIKLIGITATGMEGFGMVGTGIQAIGILAQWSSWRRINESLEWREEEDIWAKCQKITSGNFRPEAEGAGGLRSPGFQPGLSPVTKEQRRRRTLFKPTRRADGAFADFLRCSLLTYGFKYARRSRLENRQNRRRRYASYL